MIKTMIIKMRMKIDESRMTEEVKWSKKSIIYLKDSLMWISWKRMESKKSHSYLKAINQINVSWLCIFSTVATFDRYSFQQMIIVFNHHHLALPWRLSSLSHSVLLTHLLTHSLTHSLFSSKLFFKSSTSFESNPMFDSLMWSVIIVLQEGKAMQEAE